MKVVWVEGYLLPFVYYDYSELTYFEKMNAAYSACMLFSEDVTRGLWKEECQNDVWYSKLLYLLKDLGYDVSSVEEIDWDRVKEYGPFFDQIGCQLSKLIHSAKFKGEKCRRGLDLPMILL